MEPPLALAIPVKKQDVLLQERTTFPELLITAEATSAILDTLLAELGDRVVEICIGVGTLSVRAAHMITAFFSVLPTWFRQPVNTSAITDMNPRRTFRTV